MTGKNRLAGDGGTGMMIAAALLGLSLVVNAAFEPNDPASGTETRAARHMSAQQKFTALRPLIRTANDCVVRAIAADPRFRAPSGSADMSDLIVASMPPCATAMRP